MSVLCGITWKQVQLGGKCSKQQHAAWHRRSSGFEYRSTRKNFTIKLQDIITAEEKNGQKTQQQTTLYHTEYFVNFSHFFPQTLL